MARAKRPSVSKRHPWLQPSPESVALAARLNASAPVSQNGIPLALVSAELPPNTIRDRKAILKGTLKLPGIRGRAVSHYTRTVNVLPGTEAIYDSKELTVNGYPAGKRIGTLIRYGTQVVCPSCENAIQLRNWWEHGCANPLTGRSQVLADYAETTKGAAAPVYEDQPEPIARVEIPELDDPEVRWRAMFPSAYAMLEGRAA